MIKKILFFVFFTFINSGRVLWAVEIESKYGLLYDYTANEIIFSKGINITSSPSSLTKLMTAYIVFDKIKKEEISFDTKFTVSIRAWRQEGSRMFLEPEWKVNVDELLKGLLVVSGNDAAVALAEGVSGTVEDFVDLMNEMAKKIGMANTNFVNPTGLFDKQHYSTPRDLLALTIAVMDNFPEYYDKYFSLREYKFNNVLQKNRNVMLINYPGTDGVKTGNTESGGYSLIASTKRNRQRFISVVNGAEGEGIRLSDSVNLMNYGFEQYKYIDLVKKDEPLMPVSDIIKGCEDCYLYAKENIIYPIKKSKINDLKVKIIYDINNYGRAKKGDKVAILRFIEDDRIEEYDLYTNSDIKGLGKFAQFIMYFKRNCRRLL
jgi:D-alanyl-D-alanine carboxypeptidase (penicillin-binding protein 5/6)